MMTMQRSPNRIEVRIGNIEDTYCEADNGVSVNIRDE